MAMDMPRPPPGMPPGAPPSEAMMMPPRREMAPPAKPEDARAPPMGNFLETKNRGDPDAPGSAREFPGAPRFPGQPGAGGPMSQDTEGQGRRHRHRHPGMSRFPGHGRGGRPHRRRFHKHHHFHDDGEDDEGDDDADEGSDDPDRDHHHPDHDHHHPDHDNDHPGHDNDHPGHEHSEIFGEGGHTRLNPTKTLERSGGGKRKGGKSILQMLTGSGKDEKKTDKASDDDADQDSGSRESGKKGGLDEKFKIDVPDVFKEGLQMPSRFKFDIPLLGVLENLGKNRAQRSARGVLGNPPDIRPLDLSPSPSEESFVTNSFYDAYQLSGKVKAAPQLDSSGSLPATPDARLRGRRLAGDDDDETQEPLEVAYFAPHGGMVRDDHFGWQDFASHPAHHHHHHHHRPYSPPAYDQPPPGPPPAYFYRSRRSPNFMLPEWRTPLDDDPDAAYELARFGPHALLRHDHFDRNDLGKARHSSPRANVSETGQQTALQPEAKINVPKKKPLTAQALMRPYEYPNWPVPKDDDPLTPSQVAYFAAHGTLRVDHFGLNDIGKDNKHSKPSSHEPQVSQSANSPSGPSGLPLPNSVLSESNLLSLAPQPEPGRNPTLPSVPSQALGIQQKGGNQIVGSIIPTGLKVSPQKQIEPLGPNSSPRPNQPSGSNLPTEQNSLSGIIPPAAKSHEVVLNLQPGPIQQAGSNLQSGPIQQAGIDLQTGPIQQAGLNIQTGSLQQAAPDLQTGPIQQSGPNFQTGSNPQAGSRSPPGPRTARSLRPEDQLQEEVSLTATHHKVPDAHVNENSIAQDSDPGLNSFSPKPEVDAVPTGPLIANEMDKSRYDLLLPEITFMILDDPMRINRIVKKPRHHLEQQKNHAHLKPKEQSPLHHQTDHKHESSGDNASRLLPSGKDDS